MAENTMTTELSTAEQGLVTLVDDKFKQAQRNNPRVPYVSWAAVPIAMGVNAAVQAAVAPLLERITALETEVAALKGGGNGE